jgi:hypothetical protein
MRPVVSAHHGGKETNCTSLPKSDKYEANDEPLKNFSILFVAWTFLYFSYLEVSANFCRFVGLLGNLYDREKDTSTVQ